MALATALLAKIGEQIERTGHLIGRLPPDHTDWAPGIPGAWTAGVLVGHLLECLAGFCAVLAAAEPERLAHFAELRGLPVNHRCGADEARVRIAAYRAAIEEGFGLLDDGRLEARIPTLFVPEGEPVATLLLGNLEHLINHKYQLFVYLKLLGVDVGTADLYQFR
jgi:DinB family protein